MTETGWGPADQEALVRQLEERVAARLKAGEYPPELESELHAHFEEVTRQRPLPRRFVELLRRVDEASQLSEQRLEQLLPPPSLRQRVTSKLLRRQTGGILHQERLFAEAVRDLLTEVVEALPDPGAWWDPPVEYMDHLYGPVEREVERLGDLAQRLAGAQPLLVYETGRGELRTALTRLGVEAQGSGGDPRPDLRVLPDGTLGGLALRRIVERMGGPTAAALVELAARKLRSGGILGIDLVVPAAGEPDPALPWPLEPAFLVACARSAGFQRVATTKDRGGCRLLAER